MQLDAIRLIEIAMPLKQSFRSAQGEESVRRLLIVEACAGDYRGFGEVSALTDPYYTEETIHTARLILTQYLIPRALQTTWKHPSELAKALRSIQRHYMAKAGLEAAVWDLFAQKRNLSLSRAIGGTQRKISAGVALGIEKDLDALCQQVEQRLNEGYQRIKIKIKPDWDITPLQALRSAFGDIPLMADANASYTLQDVSRLQAIDKFNLTMIEQPLATDDLIDHAALQKNIVTPICLDESITTYDHARKAIQLKSCRVINVKIARVGGLSEAIRIHDLCFEAGIPLWCGGMLESGIGRAHSVALASLPGFTLPGDISASNRYWTTDIIEPEVTLTAEGYIPVSEHSGLGYAIRQDQLQSYTVREETFYP